MTESKVWNDIAGRVDHSLRAPVRQWRLAGLRALAELAVKVLPLEKIFDRDTFDVWERGGFHIVPRHFYEPIPDSADLSDAIWNWRGRTFAFDFRDAGERSLLREIARFRTEYVSLIEQPNPFEPGTIGEAGVFGAVDREVLYGLVRHLRPARVIEIGSGLTTHFIATALLANTLDGKSGELCAIEPHPHPVLVAGFPGLTRLIPMRVQEVDLTIFSELREGDILFIDSSHVHKLGSDVHHEFSNILPMLRPGVHVHFHDIFLPSEYPTDWVKERRIFWNEQHVLENFLAFNSSFEVVWGSSYMHLMHPMELQAAVPSYDPDKHWPGSFWVRRK